MSIEVAVLVKSTLLLGSAALAACLLRRASASLRHALWALTLGGLLVLPIAEVFLPEVSLAVLPTRETPVSPPPAESVRAESAQVPAGMAARLPVASERLGADVVAPAVGRGVPWLAGFWALGACVVWGRFLVGAWRLRRQERRSAACEGAWNRMLGDLRATMGLPAGVRIALRMSDRAVPPLTWGLLRHTILLPSSAEAWTRGRRNAVLAHELAHIHRRDSWSQVLAQLVLGLFWFHPLLWYAVGQMRLERERACDDRVIMLGSSPQDYADHLLAVTRSMGAGLAPAAIAMAGASQLETRLVAILDPGVSRQAPSRWSRAALSLGCVAVVLAVGSARVVAAGEPGEAIPIAPTPELQEIPVERAEPTAAPIEVVRAEAESPAEGGAEPVTTTDEGDVTELRLRGGEVLELVTGRTGLSQGETETRSADGDPQLVRIRPNDVVRIHVFSEPDLSATVRVQQDGRLSSPLVQDLPVEGLTPGELAEAIETVLGQFLTRPAVTVVLESVESYTIYVTGNVRNPGAYTFTTPVNVLQSLALAGGLSEFARRNGITIVRSRAGQEDRIFEFDYDLVVRGAASGQNIRLQTQDVVVVP